MEAFELRLWDGRIGRWLTIDPYHEFFSPYVGMGNNPISLIDPDGGMTADCPDCPGGKFDSGTEWLASDGYTYVYDQEVFGGWSTLGNVTCTAHINTNKANSHAFGAALMLRSSVMMGTAAKIDGPSPVGDLAGGLQWLMAGAVASTIYLSTTFEEDYTLTFTSREPETILLYRGVHSGHPDYHNAVLGMAAPRGFLDGHSDPVLHNLYDNNSIFTSWTIQRSTAKAFADSHGVGGIILSKRFSIYEVIPSINNYNEGEFLVSGLVSGARVEKSVLFSK